jgi:hypothetical protein
MLRPRLGLLGQLDKRFCRSTTQANTSQGTHTKEAVLFRPCRLFRTWSASSYPQPVLMTPATASVRAAKPRISNVALGTLFFGFASSVYFLAIGRIGGNLESELETEAARQLAEEQSRAGK